jgi:uncharacterized protein (TIGR02996 family)
VKTSGSVSDWFDDLGDRGDDDPAWLVFADYLETLGDHRGELIQLEARLAAMPADDPQRVDVARRIVQLTHARPWLAPLLALGLGARFEFRRGFAVAMTGRFPAATLRDRELVAAAPLLHTAALSVHGQAERVEVARPHGTAVLERLDALALTGRHAGNTRNAQGPIIDPDALARVAFRRLRRLELTRLRITVDGLRGLLASPHLGQVEHLALRLRLDRADLARVVGDLALPALRSLDLTRNEVDDAVLDRLAASPAGARLDRLAVDGRVLQFTPARAPTR